MQPNKNLFLDLLNDAESADLAMSVVITSQRVLQWLVKGIYKDRKKTNATCRLICLKTSSRSLMHKMNNRLIEIVHWNSSITSQNHFSHWIIWPEMATKNGILCFAFKTIFHLCIEIVVTNWIYSVLKIVSYFQAII